MDFLKVASRVISQVPKMGRTKLKPQTLDGIVAKSTINQLAQNLNLPLSLVAKLNKIENPIVEFSAKTNEIANKAKKDFGILGFRIKDGENVVASGAASVNGKGENALVKARVSLGKNLAEEGKAHYDVLASGHIQGITNGLAEGDVALSNRGKSVKGKFSHDAMGAKVEIDKKFMEQFPKIKKGYDSLLSKFVNGASNVMAKFKEIVTGKYKTFEEKMAESLTREKKAVSVCEKIKSPELNSTKIEKVLAKKIETENLESKARLATESSKAIKELQSKLKKKA